MFSNEEFEIVSNLRFISRANFMLSWVVSWAWKKFYNLRAWSVFSVYNPQCPNESQHEKMYLMTCVQQRPWLSTEHPGNTMSTQETQDYLCLFWANIVRYSIFTCAHYFTRNWQLPFLNQQRWENDGRKYFVINLHKRMLHCIINTKATELT